MGREVPCINTHMVVSEKLPTQLQYFTRPREVGGGATLSGEVFGRQGGEGGLPFKNRHSHEEPLSRFPLPPGG